MIEDVGRSAVDRVGPATAAASPEACRVVHGDCADVARRLAEDGLRGQVDLVYVDPPFASDREDQAAGGDHRRPVGEVADHPRQPVADGDAGEAA